MHIRSSDAWQRTFPGVHVGLLLLEAVTNAVSNLALEERLAALQSDLRQRYASANREALNTLPVVRAYQAHYKPFGQTYHVLRQVESVALKGRPIGSPGGTLVSAMFGAELSSLLLTAGHDMDLVESPLLLDVSREGDRFVGIDGQERELKPGDMLMRDGVGIISAVLYGPDQRTRLSAHTRRALFVTYAPPGIAADDVRRHLDLIAEFARVAQPQAVVAQRDVIPTA